MLENIQIRKLLASLNLLKKGSNQSWVKKVLFVLFFLQTGISYSQKSDSELQSSIDSIFAITFLDEYDITNYKSQNFDFTIQFLFTDSSWTQYHYEITDDENNTIEDKVRLRKLQHKFLDVFVNSIYYERKVLLQKELHENGFGGTGFSINVTKLKSRKLKKIVN